MTPVGIPWPLSDYGLALWHDLCAGRASAPACFIAVYLEPLLRWLRRTQPRLDDDLLTTAAHDLLIGIIKKPHQFDPAKRSLESYLCMAAQCDVLNLLKREQRHRDLFPPTDVADLAQVRNDTGEEDEREMPSFDDPRLQGVLADFTDQERCVLELMRRGERQTERYAAVLDITGLAIHEQRHQVKNLKDRIMKRLQRAVEGDQG